MKKMKNILIAILFLPLWACSQTTERTKTMNNTFTPDEQEVIATARRLTDLMIARNSKEINTLLADDFTLTHITGRVQSKAEWLKEIEQETMKYYGYEEVSVSVKMDGNRAVLTGRNRLDARIWGSRNTWNLQQVMTLEKRNGKWVILNSVASTF